MSRILAVAMICALTAFGASAADRGGQFAIEGAGLGTCDAFVKSRAAKNNAYFVFVGWMDGYLTAVNQYSPDTFDITPWESTDLLAALIDRHCKNSPQDNFFRVANSIVIELREERLREASPRILAKVGDKGVRMYRQTMRRVQEALKKRKHYKGTVDGRFGPATQNALEAFQRKQKIAVTGLPDQLTLLRLLREAPKGN